MREANLFIGVARFVRLRRILCRSNDVVPTHDRHHWRVLKLRFRESWGIGPFIGVLTTTAFV